MVARSALSDANGDHSIDVRALFKGGVACGTESQLSGKIFTIARSIGGFSVECVAATTIGLVISRTFPFRLTHAIGGNVASAGATRGVHSVRWLWGNRIVWNWVLTFPGAAIIGIFYFLTNFTIGHFIPAPIAQV